VHVHARAVVADDRLRHERRGLAVGGGGVPHRVLQDLHPVGALHERRKARADLVLPHRAYFVVMHLDLDTLLLERKAHRIADITQRVDRGTGK
jgi:hypothetical protein